MQQHWDGIFAIGTAKPSKQTTLAPMIANTLNYDENNITYQARELYSLSSARNVSLPAFHLGLLK